MPEYQINQQTGNPVLMDDINAHILGNVTSTVENQDLKFVRSWGKIPNKYLVDFDTILRARTTETNPVANKRTYTGTYAVGKVWHKEGIDKDGQIFESLAKINSVANIADLVALKPLIIQENKILNLFGLDTGEGDWIAYGYHGLNPASRATVMAISDSDMVTNLPGAGWSYEDRKFTEKSNNTADFVVLFRKSVWSNQSGTPPNQVIASRVITKHLNYDPKNNTAGLRRKKIDGAKGIQTSKAEEVFGNEPAESGWAVDSITLEEMANGQSSIKKQQSKERATGDQFTRRWNAGHGNRPEMETIAWFDLTATDATTVYDNAKTNTADMTGATPASPANHLLLTVERIPQGNGLFDVARVSWIPQAKTGTTTTWKEYQYAFPTKDGHNTTVWRYVHVKYFALEDGSDASNHLEGIIGSAEGTGSITNQFAPGTHKKVENGAIWRAVRVHDESAAPGGAWPEA